MIYLNTQLTKFLSIILHDVLQIKTSLLNNKNIFKHNSEKKES